MLRAWGRVLPVIVAVVLCGTLGAQEQTKEPEEFEVVVTATRTGVAPEDVPATLTVVTREDIEASGARKIDDVLRLLPGVDVRRSLGFVQMSPTVSLRGMGDQPGRTLVMIDGIPANKADTGNFLWNRINVDDVERVEVVRGPASALYGSHAMGGVINIITRRPTKRPETDFEFRTGTLNTQEARLKTRGRTGNLGYALTGNWLESDGYDPVPLNSEDRDEYAMARDVREAMFNLRLAPDIGRNGNLYFDYRWFDDHRGEGERIQDPRGVFRSFDTQQWDLLYDQRSGDTEWSLKLYDIEENYFWNRERLRRGKYTRYEVGVDRSEKGVLAQASHSFSGGQRLTMGVDFKRGEVDGADNYKEGRDAGLSVINQGKMDLLGVFAQYETPFAGDRGQLVVGGRFDWAELKDARYVDETGFLPNGPLPDGHWPDVDWNAFSPKAGMLYRLDRDTDLRVNIGRAFRPPILDDLVRSGIFRGRYYRANPELDPEKVWSYEVGLEHRPNDRTTLRLTGYYSNADDFFYAILIDPDFDPRPLYERRNVAAVEIFGVEGEIEHELSPRWVMFGNFTWNKSRIEQFERLSESDPDLGGKDLEFTPRWKTNFGVRFRGEQGWRGQLTGRWVDKRFGNPENTARYDSYFVADAAVSKDLGKGWSLSLEVRNLFDRRFVEGDYQELIGGRWTGHTDPSDRTSPLLGNATLDPGRLATLVVRGEF